MCLKFLNSFQSRWIKKIQYKKEPKKLQDFAKHCRDFREFLQKCLETHRNMWCFRPANISLLLLASQKMCSEQLKRFPVSSNTRSFRIWNPNFSQITLMMGKVPFNQFWIFHYLSKRLQTGPDKILLAKHFRKVH